jgi:glycosyltransferase involved in cell wall biosynthesis
MVIARDEMNEMTVLLKRLTREQQFAVVHADQLSMAGWGLLAARHQATMPGKRGPATLLDEHNAIYLLARRMAQEETHPLRRALMRREAGTFARYESRICRAYDAVLTVTEEDRGHLLALLHSNGPAGGRDMALEDKFHYVPICVDPARTRPVPRAAGGPPTILHLGTMFWPPNVNGVLWFAEQVLPRIHAQVPDARFVIAGKNPPEQVRNLAADPRIRVTGYVPDATPYLAAADAFVVPLYTGGGMRVKILDAWLWGMPIVSTPIGAEGIATREGENILIGADAHEFACATIRLLTEPDLNARLRTAGRAWVEERYSWQAVYRRVDAVYDGLLNCKPVC